MNGKLTQVLIVEDVESMKQLLELVVEEMEGFEVSGLARNGAEARLELTRRFPDLVLLDEVLPGESSLDLLAELRAVKLPVVLLTSLKDRVHELPEGTFARLLKPSWKNLEQDRLRMLEVLRRAIAIDGGGQG